MFHQDFERRMEGLQQETTISQSFATLVLLEQQRYQLLIFIIATFFDRLILCPAWSFISVISSTLCTTLQSIIIPIFQMVKKSKKAAYKSCTIDANKPKSQSKP